MSARPKSTFVVVPISAASRLTGPRSRLAFRSTALLLAGLAGSAMSQPAQEGAQPGPMLAATPPHAQTCRIIAQGTSYGESSHWEDAHGIRWSRDKVLDRGYAYDVEQQLRVDASGALRSLRIRGSMPRGPVSERFDSDADTYRYESMIDHGQGRLPGGGFYLPFSQTIDIDFALAEALLKRPGRVIDLAPSGTARLEPLTKVQVSAGGETKTLRGFLLQTGTGGGLPIWFDGQRVFGVAQSLVYGMAGGLTCLPADWEGVAPKLMEAQERAGEARTAQLVPRLAPRLVRPIAFTHVKIFDAPRRRFLDDMTVVIERGRISSVGPAGRSELPAGVQIIPGVGKTLLPGLWDSHLHFGGDDSGALLLSLGITSVRDPGNFADHIFPRIRRINQGRLLGPRIIPMMIIDGPGPYSVFIGQKVATPAEALEAVRLAHRQGFAGVKTYGSLDPALVPVIVAEARRLGLRVQGHIPHGMRALDAVRAGFNEINHANFLLHQALPDSVMQRSETLERHYGPIRLSDSIDLRGSEMVRLFDALRANRVTVDPTLGVLRHLWTDVDGELSPAYRPIAAMLPFQTIRRMKTGGLAPEPGMTRADAFRAFEKLKSLVPELYRRGIPVVAGTDTTGLELAFELELYVESGLTPAEALSTATIIPAQSFGLSDRTGSIESGKLAEVVLVSGDPSKRIGDIRNVELVVTQGRLMNASALRAAVGLITSTGAGPGQIRAVSSRHRRAAEAR